MTINEKKMNVRSVQLSSYEMASLRDTKAVLTVLFGKLTAHDNITHVAGMLTDMEMLIDELETNNNQIIEFLEDK